MPQETSTADGAPQGTESLIQAALASCSTRKIMLHPSFLDDEKLPEAERVSVLKEVFHRNIRLRQLQRLAGFLAPVVAGTLPPNLLIYGPSGTGKSVTCLHFLSTLKTMCESKNVPFR